MNLKEVSKATWVRMIALFLVLINQISVSFLGFELLPFGEEQIYEGVSVVVLVIVTIWTSWKNNSFTEKAQKADKHLKGEGK